jgi:hypothetical protein
MCETTFTVKHTNKHSAVVFGTVQEALSYIYQELSLPEQGADHEDRLNSLLNFGVVNVYCYRVQVFRGAHAYHINSVLKERGQK